MHQLQRQTQWDSSIDDDDAIMQYNGRTGKMVSRFTTKFDFRLISKLRV